ncbi:MAG: transposase [Saprospiraceae bacterium]|nr:transposase [Saprospiraceae bacterium]
MKTYYKRHLPHIQALGGTFFVTFNLHGSVPKEVYARWEEEYALGKVKIMQFSKNKNTDLERLRKLEFAKKDKFWNSYKDGNHYLKNDTLATIVADTLHHWDGQRLELYAYCIMSNHVHIVFRLFDETELEQPFYLEQIMQSIKRHSARECNKLLGQTGSPFWQNESYDRLVRDNDELRRIMVYVLNNPVKAGLCSKMSDWKWSYIKEAYNDIM